MEYSTTFLKVLERLHASGGLSQEQQESIHRTLRHIEENPLAHDGAQPGLGRPTVRRICYAEDESDTGWRIFYTIRDELGAPVLITDLWSNRLGRHRPR